MLVFTGKTLPCTAEEEKKYMHNQFSDNVMSGWFCVGVCDDVSDIEGTKERRVPESTSCFYQFDCVEHIQVDLFHSQAASVYTRCLSQSLLETHSSTVSYQTKELNQCWNLPTIETITATTEICANSERQR